MNFEKKQNQGDPGVCRFMLDELRKEGNRLVILDSNYSNHKLKDQSLEWSLEDAHTLIFVQHGNVDLKIKNFEISLEGGSLFFAPPVSNASIYFPKAYLKKSVFYHFRFQFEPVTEKYHSNPPFYFFTKPAFFRNYFEALFAEFSSLKPGREAIASGLLQVILGQSLRSLAEFPDNVRIFSALRRAHIHAFFRANVTRKISAKSMAKHLNLSKRYFTQLFRNTFHISPREWLIRKRIDLAVQKLSGKAMNISEVARDVGYTDPFLFSRHFKRIMGHSPRSFRNLR